MGLFDFLSNTAADDDSDEGLQPASDAGASAPQTQNPKPATSAAKPATAAKPTQSPTSQADEMPDFGIQKAIELMRDLPQQNVELVVQVVKKTLESMQIDVDTIIVDAKTKQAKIQGRIKSLEEEIAEFKEEIAGREEEISALKSDFAETRQVRERLEMAQKGVASKADVVAPPTGRAPASSSSPGLLPPGGDATKPGG